MLLASPAILCVSSAVKWYSKIKTVSLPWKHDLGFCNWVFSLQLPVFYKMRVDKQKQGHYTGTLGGSVMLDEDLEEK